MTLVSSITTVPFTDNISMVFAKKDKGGDKGSNSDNGGGSSSDNGGGGGTTTTKEGSGNSNGGGSSSSDTGNTPPAQAPTNQETCPDRSTPDANGDCPAQTTNNLNPNPNTDTTGQSPDVNKPCPVSEQIRNPDTGLCESVQVEGPANNGTTVPGVTVPPANGVTVPPANNGTTGPSGTVPPGLNVSGNCNAVALSDATNNSSSASSAAVTCNNSVVNKYIYQQHLTQTLPQIQSAIANKGPIIQSDNMKLDQAQVIGTNNIIVVGDFSPFRIVGGHISANLPKGNNIQIVVGEISTTGVLSKAVPLPLVKARDLTIHDTLYTTSLGNIIQGRDIVNGNTVTINSPNIIMLYNVGKLVTTSGSNSVAYTAIIA
ncbi:MAG: hypothetical protein ACTHKP_08655 [Nitrososphaeraceae archaeon]